MSLEDKLVALILGESDQIRVRIAWLIWALGEGYLKPEDRAVMDNWMLLPDTALTRIDRETKQYYLRAADELLRELS